MPSTPRVKLDFFSQRWTRVCSAVKQEYPNVDRGHHGEEGKGDNWQTATKRNQSRGEEDKRNHRRREEDKWNHHHRDK
jgi:hypothetical protein